MATFAAAVTERNRLMDAYRITARVAALSGAFGVSVHDARLDGEKVGSQSAFDAGWFAPLEPGTLQTIYP